MSGESRALGIGPRVFFDGRDCIVRPRDNNFDGFIEAECIQSRGTPMDAILRAAQELKKEDGRPDLEALAAVCQGIVSESRTWKNCTEYEKRSYLDTPLGQATTLWYCLRENFAKDWSVDRVRFVLGESLRLALSRGGEAVQKWAEWKAGLFAAIDQASGDDLLGNLTGLRLPVAVEAQPLASSSDDSAKSTDTPPTKSDE